MTVFAYRLANVINEHEKYHPTPLKFGMETMGKPYWLKAKVFELKCISTN